MITKKQSGFFFQHKWVFFQKSAQNLAGRVMRNIDNTWNGLKAIGNCHL